MTPLARWIDYQERIAPADPSAFRYATGGSRGRTRDRRAEYAFFAYSTS